MHAYSLPKMIDVDDFTINNLLPKHICKKNKEQELTKSMHWVMQNLIAAFMHHPDFSPGQNKKDVRAFCKKMKDITNLLSSDPNLFRYLEYKSVAVITNGVNVDTWKDFYKYVSFLNRHPNSISKILNIYESTLPKSGGRHKDNIMNHRSDIKIFINDLMNIYEKATGQQPTFAFSVNKTPTPCQIFIKKVLDKVNSMYPRLNNGYDICFDIPNHMARLSKSRKKI